MKYFYVVIFISVLISLFFKIKLKSFVNPVTYFCIGLTAPIFVSLLLNRYLTEGSVDFRVFFDAPDQVYFDAALLYGSALIVFAFPWCFVSSVSGEKNKKINYVKWPISNKNDLNKALWIGFFVIALIGVASAFIGAVPIFSMAMGSLDVRDLNEILKSLPFGLLSVINVATLIYFVYISSFFAAEKKEKIPLLKLVLLIIVSILVISWQGKRQQLLFVLIVTASRYFYLRSYEEVYRKSNFKIWLYIFISIFLFLAFFIIVDFTRYQGDGADALVLIGYFTWPFLNIVSIVNEFGLNSGFDGSIAVFSEILPARFGGGDAIDSFRGFLFEPTSPSGYLSYWLLDGGILFSLFGVSLFSLFSIWVYRRRDVNANRLNIYMLVLWCSLTSGIYTHFISINFFWFPFLYFIFGDFSKNISHNKKLSI